MAVLSITTIAQAHYWHQCYDYESSGSAQCGSGGEDGCSGNACEWTTYTPSCVLLSDILTKTCSTDSDCGTTFFTDTAWCTDDGAGGCDCES